MKNIIKFVLFIAYTIIIFFIDNPLILGGLFCLNIIIAIISKINFNDMMYNLKILLPFIIFTMIINIIFDSLNNGIIMGARLIICYKMTYIFAKSMTIFEISNTIEILCSPLKLFKVNTRNIGIVVSIGICMIPILNDEIHSLLKAMKSKGQEMKFSTIIVVMKPFFISVLRKTSQMEKTLIAKAYSENT